MLFSAAVILTLSSALPFPLDAMPLAEPEPPPRPHFPATFRAEFHVTIATANQTPIAYGEGHWDVDYQGNKSMVRYDVHQPDHHEVTSIYLERYDLGYKYSTNSENKSLCEKTAVTGHMPPTWSYLDDATFKGTEKYNDKEVEIWEGQSGASHTGETVDVGVYEENQNEPVLMKFNLTTNGTVFMVTYEMSTFEAKVPPDSSFKIPKECQKTIDTDFL
eukprot:m.308767 g.308767  ORF g.308767 m.308767 type:complete len:218 (+) comp44731_c0_seq1:50-703(+)